MDTTSFKTVFDFIAFAAKSIFALSLEEQYKGEGLICKNVKLFPLAEGNLAKICREFATQSNIYYPENQHIYVREFQYHDYQIKNKSDTGIEMWLGGDGYEYSTRVFTEESLRKDFERLWNEHFNDGWILTPFTEIAKEKRDNTIEKKIKKNKSRVQLSLLLNEKQQPFHVLDTEDKYFFLNYDEKCDDLLIRVFQIQFGILNDKIMNCHAAWISKNKKHAVDYKHPVYMFIKKSELQRISEMMCINLKV